MFQRSLGKNKGVEGTWTVPLHVSSYTPGKKIDVFGNVSVTALKLTAMDAKYLLESCSMFTWLSDWL